MENLLKYVYEIGISQTIYWGFFALAFIALFAMNLYRAKYFDLPKWKVMIFTVIVYSIALFWMFVLYWAEHGFTSWGGNNIVRIFVWLPIIAWPVSKIMKIDWLKSCDLVSPCLILNHGIAHFGCIFAGCCQGYPCSWGLYSNAVGYKTFPTQPLEAVAALLITAVVLRYSKKNDYKSGGLDYAIMLILFGYSRFLFEFLRDNEKLFWNISSLAIHALIAGITGTIAYFVLRKRNAKRNMAQ